MMQAEHGQKRLAHIKNVVAKMRNPEIPEPGAPSAQADTPTGAGRPINE